MNERQNKLGATTAPQQNVWQQLAEVALIVAVFFIVAGDVPPHVNESHYLCRLKHYWDQSWCSGDLFLESSDAQLVFIWLFGWVTRLVSLTTTAWIGRLLAWSLIAWAWQRLSWRVVPKRWAAVLSGAMFVGLNAYGHMAGEWVVGGVEAKCFAYGLVLFALREMIDGRWNLVWVLLGGAAAFHPIVGGWSGTICAGIWFLDARRELTIRSMLPGLLAGAALGLVGILPALWLTRGVAPETVAEAARIYVFERLAHHCAPLALPTAEATRRIVGHTALLMALVVSWIGWKSFSSKDDVQEEMNNWCPASFGSSCRAACGTPLKYLVHFALLAVLLAVAGFAIELAFQNNPLLAARLLRYYWFRMTDFAAPMAMSLIFTSLIAWGSSARKAWATPLLVIAIGFVGWFLGSVTYARWQKPFSPADNKSADSPAWIEACEWVAENSPTNALFITPRLNLSFKWRTGRPEVAIRKDLPQDAASIVKWFARLKDVYATNFAGEVQMVDSVGALGTERVKELAKKYGATFVLSDRAQLLELPVAHRNEEYVVYRIPN